MFGNNQYAQIKTIKQISRKRGYKLSDVDGFSSASLLYNYLKRLDTNIKIIYNIPEGKEHGIKLSAIPEGVDLVIVPDAGSNDFEEHKKLYQNGIDCIILDHHLADYESKMAIVVNNQLSPYPNKEFSGVGVVYKFCKALDDRLGVNYADDYLDLVALGNIGDMMSSRELETRYYMTKGLKQVKNPFFQALIDKQSYSMKGIVSINSVAFYIVPLINAMIRMGNMEEKTNMFRAFIGEQETLYNSRTKKEETLQEAMARICSNVKNKQNRVRDKGLELIEQKIKEKNLLDNKILIIEVTDILEKTLTGLVANQLVYKYQRPTLLLRHKYEDIFGGSARGYAKSYIEDFKGFLDGFELFNMLSGHSNAFGMEITSENLLKLNEQINEQLKNISFEPIYKVDFALDVKELTPNFINEIVSLSDIWGQEVEEPYVVVKNLVVSDAQVIGQKQNTIKFSNNGIDYIKFNISEEDIQNLVVNNNIIIETVGRVSINEWKGEKTPQFLIEDYNVTGEKKFVF